MDNKQNLLAELKTTKDKLEQTKKQLENKNMFWVLWKFYAQHEEWFDSFIYDSGLRIPDKELRNRQYKGDRTEGPIDFVTYDDGVRIWKEKLALESELETLDSLYEKLLVDVRLEGVLFSEISEMLGMSFDATYKIYSRRGLLGQEAN